MKWNLQFSKMREKLPYPFYLFDELNFCYPVDASPNQNSQLISFSKLLESANARLRVELHNPVSTNNVCFKHQMNPISDNVSRNTKSTVRRARSSPSGESRFSRTQVLVISGLSCPPATGYGWAIEIIGSETFA